MIGKIHLVVPSRWDNYHVGGSLKNMDVILRFFVWYFAGRPKNPVAFEILGQLDPRCEAVFPHDWFGHDVGWDTVQ